MRRSPAIESAMVASAVYQVVQRGKPVTDCIGGIKDAGLGYMEGVLDAMKSFTSVKTYSLPWAI